MSVFALSTNEDKLDLVQEQHRLSLFWIVLIIYTHYIVSIAHSIISPFVNYASILTHLRSLYHESFMFANLKKLLLNLSCYAIIIKYMCFLHTETDTACALKDEGKS